MFDIGFSELFLLGLIGLLVLGPERLPAVARSIGKFVRRARGTWDQMRNELEREVDSSGIKDIKESIRNTTEQARKKYQQTDAAMSRSGDKFKRVLDEISNVKSDPHPNRNNEQTSSSDPSARKPDDQDSSDSGS